MTKSHRIQHSKIDACKEQGAPKSMCGIHVSIRKWELMIAVWSEHNDCRLLFKFTTKHSGKYP